MFNGEMLETFYFKEEQNEKDYYHKNVYLL